MKQSVVIIRDMQRVATTFALTTLTKEEEGEHYSEASVHLKGRHGRIGTRLEICRSLDYSIVLLFIGNRERKVLVDNKSSTERVNTVQDSCVALLHKSLYALRSAAA